MKRKLVSIVLALVMVLSLVPVTAGAEPTEASPTDWENLLESGEEISTETDAEEEEEEEEKNPLFSFLSLLGAAPNFSEWTEITETTEISADGNYYLNSNVIGNITIKSGATVTLDLNGYVLQGDGTSSVITNKGNLTVQSSDTTTKHYFNYVKNGVWTLNTTASSGIAISAITDDTTDGTVIEVSGGVITGGNDGKWAGVGGVDNRRTATLSDISIVGNTAGDSGGVCNGKNEEGNYTLTMTGCTVSGNTGTTPGDGAGGVKNRGTMIMTGCTVSNNAGAFGGVSNADALDTEGRTVSPAIATLKDCTVTGNMGTATYGGVGNAGSMTLSGSTTITGNICSNRPIVGCHNLSPDDDFPVALAADFTGTVGVSVATDFGDSVSGEFATGATAEMAEHFIPDNPIYAVEYDNGKLSLVNRPISYQKWDAAAGKFVEATCTDYVPVHSYTAPYEKVGCGFEDGKWYVLYYDVDVKYEDTSGIPVKGTANLILCDGCTLNIEDTKVGKAGIHVASGDTLNIYGQSEGTGTVNAYGGSYGAGIGGDTADLSGGTVNIYGGIVNATGGSGGAGIGGGGYSGGTVTVYGGSVNATGGSDAGSDAAGIGGSNNGSLYVANNMIVKRGDSANPTAVVEHAGISQDIAGDDQYVTIREGVAQIVETGKYYDTVQAAVTAATAGQTVKMLANSKENVTVANDKNITLDLNGHVLQGDGTSSVITNNGNLTVQDSNTGSQTHNFKVGTDGLWTLTDETADAIALEALTARPADNAIITVTGGVITGGKADNYEGDAVGGGIRNVGTLNIYGGNIVGNTAYYGGGISTNKTTTISNGSVIGNTSTCEGAGIYMHGDLDDNSLTLEDGKIAFNTVASSTNGAAGVFVSGTFTMNGGEISGNKAKSGAGVYVYYNDNNAPGVFTMTSGTIKNNIASDKGGGVYVDNYANVLLCGTITGNTAGTMGGGVCCNSPISVSGSVNISGNTVDGEANNVFVRNTSKAAFAPAATATNLTNSASIGISAETTGVVVTGATEGMKSCFTSDSADYAIKFVTDHLELARVTVKIADGIEHGTITVSDLAAEAGDIVTVTATPDEGYQMETIIVYKTGDLSTEVEVNEDGTFTMPGYDVTVAATFTEEDSDSPLQIVLRMVVLCRLLMRVLRYISSWLFALR